ncbi:ABC transporter substrate-binding protein [Streptomyces bugieae]|uniref:ABC transporter substrate-binding protein n=1 Tax=Streptomyces bugieae TaxID=3098223 RepID=A0ABU7NMA5_9ACTN|nr:ABC transporter substrate-binding protein [Streptomyces sp. DSM 41528]
MNGPTTGPQPGTREVPAPHTEVELAALIGLLTGHRSRIRSVAVGHGRDGSSRAAAQAFTAAWQALGKDVLAVVDWPEHAASWLRPARRLTAQTPDAWVLAGAPAGVAPLLRRLRRSTDWDPARTVGFASLGTPRLVELARADTVHGLRGASRDGGTWDLRRGWATHYLPAVAADAQR